MYYITIEIEQRNKLDGLCIMLLVSEISKSAGQLFVNQNVCF